MVVRGELYGYHGPSERQSTLSLKHCGKQKWQNFKHIIKRQDSLKKQNNNAGKNRRQQKKRKTKYEMD